ncbi:MAG TPA: MFS transporter [Bauldia sp.]|nr:MFS transporter [Bauldia sp.]
MSVAAVDTATPRLPTWITSARLVMAVYFAEAVTMGTWFPRIPDVQAALGLGPAQLAIALLGSSTGGFIASMFAPRLIERITPRRAMMLGFLLYCLALELPGWAWDTWSLLAALFIMGTTYVLIDLSMNVEAARIQQATGRRIMSKCHGFWSLGSICGLLVGAMFAGLHTDLRWQAVVVGVVAVPVGALLGKALPVVAPAVRAKVREFPVTLPTPALATLCIFAFGVLLAELTTRNWGAVYLREALGASPALGGIGLAEFSLFMAIGRLSGDRLTERFGPVVLGRGAAALAVVGVGLLLVAHGAIVAAVALAALGLGVSVGYPLTVTAAASRGDRTPARNVASLSAVSYVASVVGPPLVGFVAQSAGLRWGLATILPLMILSALFAGSLRRRPLAESAAPR